MGIQDVDKLVPRKGKRKKERKKKRAERVTVLVASVPLFVCYCFDMAVIRENKEGTA